MACYFYKSARDIPARDINANPVKPRMEPGTSKGESRVRAKENFEQNFVKRRKI